MIAAYEIDHAKVGSHGPNPAVNRMARTFKGYGIVVREPDANETLFWFVTHSTTLSKARLTRLRGLINPDRSAAILVVYWPTLKDGEQIPILMNYMRGSTHHILEGVGGRG